MTRLQVSLPDEQVRRLEVLARKRKTSTAHLLREGIEFVLRQKRDAPPDPLLDLIGQAGRISRRDIAGRHDAYLAEIERKRNQ